jgi:hypothetical protein
VKHALFSAISANIATFLSTQYHALSHKHALLQLVHTSTVHNPLAAENYTPAKCASRVTCDRSHPSPSCFNGQSWLGHKAGTCALPGEGPTLRKRGMPQLGASFYSVYPAQRTEMEGFHVPPQQTMYVVASFKPGQCATSGMSLTYPHTSTG